MPINCSCEDAPAYRNRGQLRAAMLARMGFAVPLGSPTTRTLAQIRESMLYLLGYGAQINNPPPGVAGTLNAYVNEAQQALFRRLELDQGSVAAPAFMAADADPTTLDYQPVQTLAMAMACAHYGKPEAKAYFEQHEKYVGDVAARRPPGLVAMLDEFLAEAQRTLLRRFPELHTKRWFAWPLNAGERFYDLTANLEIEEAAGCTKRLDPLSIAEAWVEDGTSRYPIRHGIPSAYIASDVTGRPTHFDVGACIEVWPAPAATEGRLLLRGRYQVLPFAADTDPTTIDDHAVYMLALANAKAHYKQPDASQVMSESEVYLQNLAAGTHGAKRYIPGRSARDTAVYVEPRPSEPFA